MKFRPLSIPLLLTLGVSSSWVQAQLLVTEIQSDGLSDYWELTNTGSEPRDLSGYKWDDDSENPDDPAAVTIPPGTIIAPGESIVFAGAGVGSAENFRTQWGLTNNVQVIVGGPNFGGGDGVAFFDPSKTKLFF
ncbi:MAG: lamin tail domain-containing protein, partial [Verrucomicrobiaceae bacterium]